MIKKILLFIAGAFYLINAAAQVKPEWDEVFKNIYGEIDKNAAAYENLQQSTTYIGHRLTGSANGARAEEQVFNLLRSYGYEPRYQAFETESWSRGNLSLKINGMTYKAVSLAHSPVQANITGTIANLGNGLEEDYANNKIPLKDKIVFVYLGILPGSKEGTRNLHRSEKTALAIKNGAAGIIFFNAAPGDILLTGTASVDGKLISIPAICISNNDGLKLRERFKTGTHSANIVMNNFSGRVQARNVIATLPGKSLPEEKIVIGGHLDSWDLATGAIDNGIGSFAVVDMARTFKALQLQPARTVEFVLFMGEEQGLLGSKAYVEEALADGSLGAVKYMLNFDMTNDPRGYHTSVEEDKDIVRSIGDIAKNIDTAFANTYSAGLGLHSDHQPFLLQGIPTGGASGRLSREVLNCYHADCDAFDLVNEQELKNTTFFGSILLYGLADAETLKAQRMSDEVLREKLEKANLKEALQIAGEWRWEE
ncbi:MAG: M28 family peptidase [Chitinophagaceae bacterium]|nr:M28 family peptidase [Chitinophagaceae bacterium]MCW5928124.1 M28 family peptidase [Chitinophagaceae bacterium]